MTQEETDKYSDRDKEVFTLIKGILDVRCRQVYDPNGPDFSVCPLCLMDSHVEAEMGDIKHDVNCIYLIAKDLSRGIDLQNY